MTQITLQDGKIVLRDGKVGTEPACCCGEPPCSCDSPYFSDDVHPGCNIDYIAIEWEFYNAGCPLPDGDGDYPATLYQGTLVLAFDNGGLAENAGLNFPSESIYEDSNTGCQLVLETALYCDVRPPSPGSYQHRLRLLFRTFPSNECCYDSGNSVFWAEWFVELWMTTRQTQVDIDGSMYPACCPTGLESLPIEQTFPDGSYINILSATVVLL